MDQTKENLLTIGDMALRLGLSKRWVSDRIRAGEMDEVVRFNARVVRVPEDSFLRFMAKRKTNTAAR